ncbi:RCC1 domain-containing protein [Niabella hirudinis]|uniref:RCC1 domain-containing protein n=1 Tax=Niabella hirudinis TaxID=1285929 RepID=UPI003EBDA19F
MYYNQSRLKIIIISLLLGCSKPGNENKNTENSVSTNAKWIILGGATTSGGGGASMGLKSDGTLWVWGKGTTNNIGGNFLGLGASVSSNVPLKVLDNVADFYSDYTTATFAIKKDGSLWGTGGSTHARTLSGPATCGAIIPSRDFYLYPFEPSRTDRFKFEQIGSGADWKTFSKRINEYVDGPFIQKKDYSIWVSTTLLSEYPGVLYWGKNNEELSVCPSGQIPLKWNRPLGTVHYQPILNSSTEWESFYKNYGISLYYGIKKDGTLWTLRFVSENDKNINPNLPVQIGSENNWSRCISFTGSELFLKKDGTLWSLQPGSSYPAYPIPKQVGSDKWKDVKASFSHPLGFRYAGIKSDGTLWAWGRNDDGLLGTGNYTSTTVPVRISTETNWESVHEGPAGFYVINMKGEVWGWGRNLNGALGDGTSTDKYVPTFLFK